MHYNAGDIVDVADTRANHIYRARVVGDFDEEDGDGLLELYQDEPITIDGDEIDVGEEIPFNLEIMTLSLYESARHSL